MIDVSTNLKALLSGSWTASVAPKYCIQNYGLDPKNLYGMYDQMLGTPQISINDEVKISETPITKLIYRMNHECMIGVFERPVTYMPNIISGSQVSHRAMIFEVDRIFRTKRYTATPFNEIKNIGWTYQSMKDKEPIILQAYLNLNVFYIEGD